MRIGSRTRALRRLVLDFSGTWLRMLACSALALTWPNVGMGSQPGISAKSFQHTVWTGKDGAPADVWAIAQTNDGWLWFGGRTGVTRFDGVRFSKVDGLSAGSGISTAVSALYALPSGGLAIGHVSGGISLLRDGNITAFDTDETRQAGPIVDFVQGRDGVIWASSLNGLMRFDRDRWQTVGQDWAYPGGHTYSVFVDADDTLWVATTSEILRLPSNARRFERVDVPLVSAAELIQSPDGRMWFSDDRGTLPMPIQPSPLRPPIDGSRKSYVAMFDRAGNYWSTWIQAGMAIPESVVRDLPVVGSIKTVFQDRNENLWLSETGAAIHRLRRPGVVKLDIANSPFPAGLWPNTSVALDASDRLWLVTALSGSGTDIITDGVWTIDGGRLRSVQRDEIKSATAIARDASAALWIGGRQGIWKLQEDRFHKAVELPDAARDAYIAGLSVDCSGGFWASARGVGLFRHDGHAWQRNGNVEMLPAIAPTVQTCDSRGRLWLGYSDGTVSVVDGGRAYLFTAENGPRVGVVSAISAGRQTLVGGERGLALFQDGRFHTLKAGLPFFDGVTSIVEQGNGDVWVNGARGVAHIVAAELQKPPVSGELEVIAEFLDESDGYPGSGFNLAGPQTTLAITQDQRIWLSADGGIATIDPARIRRDVAVSPVVIESVDADGRPHELSQGMRLPAGTRSLAVNYTALNYSHAERLRFRYRLDGVDDGWVSADARRQAFYTNLGPGRYRFAVNVTDANGSWTDSSASLDFVVPPTFVQSPVFYAICAGLAVVLLTLAYRANVQRIEARQRRLLEERLGERERIARELHDTLLQGTQALIFQLQVAIDALPADSPARARLSEAVESAENAMVEGRDRIQDLRARAHASDALEQSLALAGAELARGSATRFGIVVEGPERPIEPDVVDLSYRIGREALVNAFRHARAETIEVQVIYADDVLRLCVRDDGVGIDAQAVERGSLPGHWGLRGMRERAEAIGASLEITSRRGAGTEISLSVPASIAYRKTPGRSWWTRFGS